jgi:hypothetical protein
MPSQTNSRYAAGTINPFRFIQTDPASIFYPELSCLQCSGPGVEILGIAQEYTSAMMGQALAPAQGFPAAFASGNVRVYGDGEETILMVGSGQTIFVDNLLTSDASGCGVPVTLASASNQFIGARALENGLAGDPIRVTVVLRPYTKSA